MIESAKVAVREYQREYMREYRAKNVERIRERERAWRKAHPDKVREYQERYWAKKSAESKKKTVKKA